MNYYNYLQLCTYKTMRICLKGPGTSIPISQKFNYLEVKAFFDDFQVNNFNIIIIKLQFSLH